MRGYDTFVSSNGVRGAQVSGRYPSYSKVASVEGVVVEVHFVDDTSNRSKQYVEYDVRDLRTGQIYTQCRRLSDVSGLEDGSENVLRPAKTYVDVEQVALFDKGTSPLTLSDGDRVMLQFMYGAQHSPVVVGILPHGQMQYGAKRADGFRRFTTHKGTSVETKEDGTYIITREIAPGAQTSITIESNGDVKVEHESGAKLHILQDGTVRLDGLPFGLRLGFNATQKGLLGDAFLSALGTFFSAVATAVGTSGTPPGASAAGASIAAAQAAFTALASTYLSQKVMLE